MYESFMLIMTLVISHFSVNEWDYYHFIWLISFLDEWMDECLLYMNECTITLILDMQSWKILFPLVYFFDDLKKGENGIIMEKVVYYLSEFF